MTPLIIVHGGAGSWSEGSARLEQAIEACRRAASVGRQMLLNKGSAVSAVEEAVRILEDDPALDAGIGSYPNSEGQIELDALIMDGSNLNLGAVAAVREIKNPITLARFVMAVSNHNFLVGTGAEAFADSLGLERCTSEELMYDWSRSMSDPLKGASLPIADYDGPSSDTVGAVALDIFGNLAAATSTGGTRNKLPGRVGDSPLVGSGAYADNLTAAVSATGDGEALMKLVVSKRVCELIAGNLSAQEACEAVIRELGERVQGSGGLIALDYKGRIGIAFNTEAMPHAAAKEDKPIASSCFQPLRF